MYHISTNQLAEFYRATEKGKSRIIQQQVNPNKIRISWYQLAKSAIKRYLKNTSDIAPLQEAIKMLHNRTGLNKRQLIDRNVSIESLQRLIKLNIHKKFRNYHYEVIKPAVKETVIDGVQVHITPDLIFKTTISDQIVVGGVRVHISKDNPFDSHQCLLSSTLLVSLIEENYLGPEDVVSPALCYTIDVFSERIVSAQDDYSSELTAIKRICEEIKTLWPKK